MSHRLRLAHKSPSWTPGHTRASSLSATWVGTADRASGAIALVHPCRQLHHPTSWITKGVPCSIQMLVICMSFIILQFCAGGQNFNPFLWSCLYMFCVLSVNLVLSHLFYSLTHSVLEVKLMILILWNLIHQNDWDEPGLGRLAGNERVKCRYWEGMYCISICSTMQILMVWAHLHQIQCTSCHVP